MPPTTTTTATRKSTMDKKEDEGNRNNSNESGNGYRDDMTDIDAEYGWIAITRTHGLWQRV